MKIIECTFGHWVQHTGIQPLSAVIPVNSHSCKQQSLHAGTVLQAGSCVQDEGRGCVRARGFIQQIDSEHPAVPLAGASKLWPFRENKVFGTSVFFQTVRDAVWLFPSWNQVFKKKSGCFVKIRDCCVKIAERGLPVEAPCPPALPLPSRLAPRMVRRALGLMARAPFLPVPQAWALGEWGLEVVGEARLLALYAVPACSLFRSQQGGRLGFSQTAAGLVCPPLCRLFCTWSHH